MNRFVLFLAVLALASHASAISTSAKLKHKWVFSDKPTCTITTTTLTQSQEKFLSSVKKYEDANPTLAPHQVAFCLQAKKWGSAIWGSDGVAPFAQRLLYGDYKGTVANCRDAAGVTDADLVRSSVTDRFGKVSGTTHLYTAVAGAFDRTIMKAKSVCYLTQCGDSVQDTWRAVGLENAGQGGAVEDRDNQRGCRCAYTNQKMSECLKTQFHKENSCDDWMVKVPISKAVLSGTYYVNTYCYL